MRGGDKGRRLESRDRGCPWGRGGLTPLGASGGWRVDIGRILWPADAQYAEG